MKDKIFAGILSIATQIALTPAPTMAAPEESAIGDGLSSTAIYWPDRAGTYLSRQATTPSTDASTDKVCGPDVDLRSGAVFTLLNLRPDNQVLAYGRNSDGSLCLAGTYNTGGTSDSLGATASGQNGVIASEGYVFATNPGSADGAAGDGSVSVLRIEKDKLVLTDVEPSGGPNPRSVTRHGDMVYVVNSGSGVPTSATKPTGPGGHLNFARALPIVKSAVSDSGPAGENVQGYRFNSDTGKLVPLAGSNIATIDADGDPAQIEFTPDGEHLVISQRRVNGLIITGSEPRYIEVMNVGSDGSPTSVLQYDVGGDAPFGFRIAPDNTVYLTHGLVPDAVEGGISAHRINADGTVTTLTKFIQDGAAETCWNYLSQTTKVPYMYTSATFDSAVGLSKINTDSTLTLINSRLASSASSGENRLLLDQGGLDMHGAVDATGAEYLYVLNNPIFQPLGLKIARIVGYKINSDDGSLTQLDDSVARNITNNGFGLWAF